VWKDSIGDEFPLAKYAAQHWTCHTNAAGNPPILCKLALDLLQRDKPCYMMLLRLHDIDRSWQTSRVTSKRNVDSPISPLYYATLTGLTDVARSLLQQGEDPDKQCGLYGNALIAAALKGREEILRQLIRYGADPNARGGMLNTALLAASGAGHEKIVRTLLERGADVRQDHYRWGNALVVAIRNGHEAVVRVLIDHGVNVNS